MGQKQNILRGGKNQLQHPTSIEHIITRPTKALSAAILNQVRVRVWVGVCLIFVVKKHYDRKRKNNSD